MKLQFGAYMRNFNLNKNIWFSTL